jgi:hypothetical protein
MKRNTLNKISAWVIAFVMAMVCQNVSAQGFTATGRVCDSNDEPLIGATIKAVGTTLGTVTDIDGNFSLDCNSGAMLDVSYIGYNSQQVKATSGMKVVLSENATLLREATVVGVGYGAMRKADLTGAIASVSAEDMKQGVITSTEQLLQGKEVSSYSIQAAVYSHPREMGVSYLLQWLLMIVEFGFMLFLFNVIRAKPASYGNLCSVRDGIVDLQHGLGYEIPIIGACPGNSRLDQGLPFLRVFDKEIQLRGQ